jgi:hypothetical protein
MMDFPTFRFVDTALNGVNNRNKIMDIQQVKNYNGLTDSYMTYFRYNNEMIFHFREKRSVKGYQGQAYADWLPIDIDSEDLQEAQDSLQKFVQNLQRYEIDHSICRFYFSGSKGFHIMIPSKLFGALPSEDIHKRFRSVALSLSNGIKIDTSIYDKTRIFRLPNTINSRSNLFKIELYSFQALNLPIEEIQEIAKQPGKRLEVETEFETNEQLKEIYDAPLDRPTIKKDNSSVEGVKAYLCMMKLNQGVGHGERDNVGVRVASHLKKSGLSKPMIWSALNAWNEQNSPPLQHHELERIFEQGLTQYEFGCHDHILQSHCDKRCVFYKEEWGRF